MDPNTLTDKQVIDAIRATKEVIKDLDRQALAQRKLLFDLEVIAKSRKLSVSRR